MTTASVIRGTIEDNIMRNVTGDGIDVASNGFPAVGVIIRGNNVETTTGSGLFVDESDGLQVADNYFLGVLDDMVLGGGGLYLESGGPTLTNVTGTGNSGTNGGGIHVKSGTINARNTIVANSTSGGDYDNNAIISLGGNLDEDGTCSFETTSDPSGPPTGQRGANAHP